MTGAPKHGVPIKMNCMFTGITPAHMPATFSTSNEAPDQYRQGTLNPVVCPLATSHVSLTAPYQAATRES